MMTEKLSCGVDIGSRKIKASIIKTGSSKRYELLAAHEAATRGLSGTSIADLGELSECLNHAIATVGRKAGRQSRDIHLGIGGMFIEAKHSHAVIPIIDRGNTVITSRHMARINRHARLLGVGVDETVLHGYPQRYLIDDHHQALNPLGLYGRKLEVEFLLITAGAVSVGNLTKAVNQAGYEVSGISCASLAAGGVVVDSTAQIKGCACIDIGASATTLLFVKDGVVRDLKIIPGGGDAITAALSQKLHLPFDLAEDIKKSYAVAIDDTHSAGEVLIKRDARYVPIRREDISAAIEPAVSRLVSDIQGAVSSPDYVEYLSGSAVIAGGCSLLPGLVERIEHALAMPMRLGKVRLHEVGAAHAVVIAASVGLAQNAIAKAAHQMLSPRNVASPFGRMLSRASEIYHEYF